MSKVERIPDRWVDILQLLARRRGPTSGRPGRIAYLIGLGAAGRPDAKVRPALEAMERRGWIRGSLFDDWWRITETGRRELRRQLDKRRRRDQSHRAPD